MRKIYFTLLIALTTANLLPYDLLGQAGYVDTSFYKGHGVDFKCTGGLVQPDSSVIAIGRFGWVNERFISGVVKLNQEGELDYSFNIGTGADEHVNQIVRQPDGKLIIAGDFRTFNGDSVFHIIRLNPDGSRDNTFIMGSGFTVNGTVYSLYLQPDGKILAGGVFIDYNGSPANYLVRINPDGSFDNTFNIGSGFNNTVYSIDRQTDGKYIVAGNFSLVNGDSLYRRIVRLHPDGSIDTTFKSGITGFNNIVTRAKLQANGKIIAVGFFTSYRGSARNRIARINADGTLDATYNVGTGFNNNVNDLVIQPDGKCYATGNFTTYKGATINRIVRIDTVGNRDNSFAPGTGLNASCNAVFLNYDNKPYVGGTATAVDSFVRLRLVRFLINGKVDNTFFKESKINNQSYASAIQSDGKIILVGDFTRCNHFTANRIVRLNTDGSIDTTFKSGTGANNTVRAVAVLPGNKILIGGNFTSYNGIAINRLARLNQDGSLDTTFLVGGGLNAQVYSIVPTAQGKIYVAGSFRVYGTDSVFRLMRLNANGTLDNTFPVGNTGFNGYVHIITLQPDGKILAGGGFTAYKGVTANRIVRINTDASIDGTFATGTGFNNIVYAIALGDSGNIAVGGDFTTYKGSTKNRIVLLSNTGTVKPFSASVTSGSVFDIEKVGKGFLIGGSFTAVSGSSRRRLAYADSTGSVNNSLFYIGGGLDNTLNNMFVDTAQQLVYLSGNFTTVQFALYNRFARLTYSNIRVTKIATMLCPGAITKVYFEKNGNYSPGNVFTVQLSDSLGSFANPVSIGAKTSSANGTDSVTVYFPPSLSYGSNYRVRILASNPEDISNQSLPILVGAPQAPPVYYSGPLSFCAGDSVVLTVSEGSSFSWNNGSSDQSISVKNSGSYIVTVNNNNCIASSDTINIIVLASPDSSISIEITSLCGTGSVKLSGQPGLSYAWSIGPTSQSITVNQDGIYTLSVTDSSGCKSDSTLNLDLTTFFNTLIYAQGPITICQGSSVVLRTYPGANSYLWSSGQTSDSIVVTTGGTYQVTVSDGICSKTSSPITVVVNQAPTVSFSLPLDTFCQGTSSVILSGSPAGGTFSGNGVNGGTFSPAGLGNTNAVVEYSYTGSNNCTSTVADTAYVALCTNIGDITDNSIMVFPNPAAEAIYIAGLQAKPYDIEITDALGATVVKSFIETTPGTEKVTIHHLAQGQYVISINNKKFRFIKQ